MSQQQLRRRKHAGQRGGADGDDGATGEDGGALRESLLTRSSDGDGDGGGEPPTAAAAAATAGPLILRPGPFSVVAFLSAVVERWLALVCALVRGGGGGNRAHPNNNNRAPFAARRAGAAPAAPSGAAGAAPTSSSSAAAAAAGPGILHLREVLAEPYLADDLEHQDALLELWALAFGPDGPEPPARRGAAAGGDGCARCGAALRSARWQEMGWQGLDPATDFRGAGRFGLDNLLALGRRRPALFRALLRKERVAERRSAWEYPFCVAGLNLTFGLGDMLEVVAGGGAGGGRGAGVGGKGAAGGRRGGGGGGGGGPRTAAGRAFASMVARAEAARGAQASKAGAPAPDAAAAAATGGASQSDAAADDAAAADAAAAGPAAAAAHAAARAAERAFEEVYAAAFALLDAVWLERGAGYMEFGAVMADTRARLASALARCAGEPEDAGGAGAAKKGGAVARAWAALAGGGGGSGGARRRNGGGPQLSVGAGGGAVAPGLQITARDIGRAAGLDDEVLAML